MTNRLTPPKTQKDAEQRLPLRAFLRQLPFFFFLLGPLGFDSGRLTAPFRNLLYIIKPDNIKKHDHLRQ